MGQNFDQAKRDDIWPMPNILVGIVAGIILWYSGMMARRNNLSVIWRSHVYFVCLRILQWDLAQWLWLKIVSNFLSIVWYNLRPSQQSTVSLNYSQSIKINIGLSDGRTIVPLILYNIEDRCISSKIWGSLNQNSGIALQASLKIKTDRSKMFINAPTINIKLSPWVM